MRRLLLICWLLWWNPPSFGACSGSGTVWSCTSGTTPSQINSTISSASDGATLTFDPGSYTWGGGTTVSPSLTKGLTLICASADACSVSASGVVFTLPAGVSGKLYRISGFAFSHSGANLISTCPGGSCADTVLSQFRFDHNSISQTTDDTIFLIGDGDTITYLYGSVDNNTFTKSTNSSVLILYVGKIDASPPSGRLASSANLFFEDNTFTITTNTDGGVGCIDGWSGMGVVWRYNSTTNCRILMHGVTHAWGPLNWEVYNNSLTFNSGASFPDGYRSIHHQGSGTYMVWGNTITTSSAINSSAIVVLHYRSFGSGSGSALCDGTVGVDGNRSPTGTYRGYPCFRQPGRDADGTLHPIFAWANVSDGGARVVMEINAPGGSPDYTTTHIVENRDLYNAVSANAQTSTTSPFNGTTGMGFGTLANRPTTCTTNSEPADAGNGGVGYWVTDQGEWNSANGSTADGRLDVCTSTNTWTEGYYVPYTYPHPLRGESPASSGSSRTGGGTRSSSRIN